jgi:NAD(P)-dependent dehydrogenase (short-subunit alcohol dehydrogenase family)
MTDRALSGGRMVVSTVLAKTPPPMAVVNLIGGYTPPHALTVLAGQGGGTIVHVSSRVADGKGENEFAYSVSKLGVIRLAEAAAAEGREQGIRVNCVMPSIFDTPANRAAMPNAKHHRWPKPSELAAVLAFLVSDDAALISGAAIPVYGRA